MAWPKKNAVPAEEAAEMPVTAPKKKNKGKMPAPGAAKPAWRSIADQMAKK